MLSIHQGGQPSTLDTKRNTVSVLKFQPCLQLQFPAWIASSLAGQTLHPIATLVAQRRDWVKGLACETTWLGLAGLGQWSAATILLIGKDYHSLSLSSSSIKTGPGFNTPMFFFYFFPLALFPSSLFLFIPVFLFPLFLFFPCSFFFPSFFAISM